MRSTGKIILIAASFFSVVSCTNVTEFKKDDTERKIDELLSKMTLEEKIGQMHQISIERNIEKHFTDLQNGNIGSVFNTVNPIMANQIQKVAVEESRLGIPILFARDVIHGFKTIFPIPLGQAATFNPALIQEGARIAAVEASAAGVRWTFAPMMDISRDARWGRIAESCGEDTYLTEKMAEAMVRGFQGDDLSNPASIASCPKHFVGYGAAESGRDYNSTYITERQLRNVYLPPFEAAVKAGAATIMTSFNDNDGIPASGNPFILRTVLRDEWGFDGVVVSDWSSVTEMVSHGFCSDRKDAARKSVNAGVDIEMVSGSFIKHIPDLVGESCIDMNTIDAAVRNILRIKFRLGLFDNPYVNTTLEDSAYYHPNHLAAAKQTAVESVVLLKNEENVLPIRSDKKRIAIVGPLADAQHDQLGTWVFDSEEEKTVTPLNAIRESYGDKYSIIYEPGLTYSRDNNVAGIAKAVNAAKQADIILAFVGEESILSGEAHSLADISLQGKQSQLLAELSKTGKPLVTVIMAGRPLTIENDLNVSDALMYAWHPGTMGGEAIADLLFGECSPSGKLPVTFPRMVGQIPIYYNRNNTGRPARGTETLIHEIPLKAGQTSLGCNSYWLDAGYDELFPFGYGLSYTKFNYDSLNISSDRFSENDTVKVNFTLENIGDFEGTEIVQLYVQDKVGSVTRPIKELKRFDRITLSPGEKQNINFSLPVKELAFWNLDMEKVVEPGDFVLMVGPNSKDLMTKKFVVE